MRNFRLGSEGPKKTGTIWVVMGDTYWSAKGACFNPGGEANSIESSKRDEGVYSLCKGYKSYTPFLKPKTLCQIPSRFAIEMCNRWWILRNSIIWQKPNCVPSSAKDRFTVDYEFLFFLTKSRTYFFEQQFEAYNESLNRWGGQIKNNVAPKQKKYLKMQKIGSTSSMRKGGNVRTNPCGRNRRCVWKVPTQPWSGPHYAVFPEKLIAVPIKAGCPKGGIVLDPFIGSGTTAAVAKELGRNFIGIAVNPDYCEMTRKRVASVS